MRGQASRIGSSEAVDYVEFRAAGEAAAGEFHCSSCRYGVTVARLLPRCPMCGGTAWEESPRQRSFDALRLQ